MDAFIFHNPTRFVFGPEAEQQTGEQVRKLGIGKVLLVYGQGSVVRSGLLARAFCHEIDHLDGILYTDIADKVYRLDEE